MFVATGTNAEIEAGLQAIRRSLSFYASTPAYRPVLDLHGWTDIGEALSQCAARGQWQEMPGMVTQEMLEAARYGGRRMRWPRDWWPNTAPWPTVSGSTTPSSLGSGTRYGRRLPGAWRG